MAAPLRTSRQALRLIRYHGVVLEAAHGVEPSLAERIAGEPIRSSWWGHRRGRAIFGITTKVHASAAVLVCTLAGGKITYVHRRLWPAFVRLAHRFPPRALDRVRQVHLPSGRHQRQDVPFPRWVPGPVRTAAAALSRRQAESEIAVWLERYGH